MRGVAKAHMTEREREIRSRLAQILSSEPLVRATISDRRGTCGKSECRCARGHRHHTLYLVASKQGKLHQLFVPEHLTAEARQYVASYKKVRALLEELSSLYWEKLQRREP